MLEVGTGGSYDLRGVKHADRAGGVEAGAGRSQGSGTTWGKGDSAQHPGRLSAAPGRTQRNTRRKRGLNTALGSTQHSTQGREDSAQDPEEGGPSAAPTGGRIQHSTREESAQYPGVLSAAPGGAGSPPTSQMTWNSERSKAASTRPPYILHVSCRACMKSRRSASDLGMGSQ